MTHLHLHLHLQPQPRGPPAAAGLEGGQSLESASPSVSRAPVSQSQTSPPSLTVSPTVRPPASRYEFKFHFTSKVSENVSFYPKF